MSVIIIGAGAAGLMCAIEAGKRKRKVLVLDHANKLGKKILMSGGGRCNFTNYKISPDRYISHNPHFCKSALSRYTQTDFISLVKKHKISYHEKTAGQLFCDHKSQDIVNMLIDEADAACIEIRLETQIQGVQQLKKEQGFQLKTNRGEYVCESLVIASGGLSIPTLGASPFGYKIAEQFGIKVWPTRAGLVPFTLRPEDKAHLSTLSGVSVFAEVSNHRQSFRDDILFTHRGLSGPAILQISSYWEMNEEIVINLLPDLNVVEYLKSMQGQHPKKQLSSILAEVLPKRVVETFVHSEILSATLGSIAHRDFLEVGASLNHWVLLPNGTEGYRTAEVTLGGVDCDALSSKTMEVKQRPGLYFIGEVVDVSGWLGGYNFQWAWSSGWAAGQVV